MIDYEVFCQIKQQQAEGLKATQIVLALGLDERTTRKWMSGERYRPAPERSAGQQAGYLRDRDPRLARTAPVHRAQIFQKLRQEGYAGGVTS